ncbi:hypothetical protein Moror_11423 [Moniliophthora roreri MCA 2997]|uniref:Uncharacterized protein n=2 Tax=Moniliophthora roreri TaxID=221103 RepID=V2WU99_MONRO|nr:hypothetical protein Moror_11423 [Moniliophthora roreri MCA 2997]
MSASLLDPNFAFPSSIPVVPGPRARMKTTGSSLTPTSNDWDIPTKVPKTPTWDKNREGNKSACRTEQNKAQRRSVQVQQRSLDGHASQRRSTQSSAPFSMPFTTITSTTSSTPSSPYTMQTRIAVRDKSPHRFQVVPLKEARPNVVEKRDIGSGNGSKIQKTLGTENKPLDRPKDSHLSVPSSRTIRSLRYPLPDSTEGSGMHLHPIQPLSITKFLSDSSFTATTRRKSNGDGSVHRDLPTLSRTTTTSTPTSASKLADANTIRSRTLSERDPNRPSWLSTTKAKHARSLTAKHASTMVTTPSDPSRDPSVKTRNRSTKEDKTSAIRSYPHLKSSSLGTVFARSIWSVPSSKKSESQASLHIPEQTTALPETRETADTKTQKRAYSLDVLNRSRLLKFASLRPSNTTSRQVPHARNIFPRTEKHAINHEHETPTFESLADHQSVLKRRAIYSHSLFVPTPKPAAQPEYENVSPGFTMTALRVPAVNHDSIDPIVHVHGDHRSSISSTLSIPPVPAPSAILPLSCSRTSLSRSRSCSLVRAEGANDTGSIQYHPIVMELIQAIDATINTWNGIDSALPVFGL